MIQKRINTKMHVKQGDIVQIISGKHKGQIGEIQKIIRKQSKVIINDINLKTKHSRPKQENETGQITQIASSIHSSNVMLYSNKAKIASRYKTTLNKEQNKERVLKKTGETV